jgi:general secretion pathway protein K
MRRGVDKREGMALLTVLLLVAVMSVVAVAVLDDVRFSVRRATNAETQAQAQWYASGAEALARRQIARLLAAGRAGHRWSPGGTAAASASPSTAARSAPLSPTARPVST